MINLPLEYTSRMKSLLGENFDRYIDAVISQNPVRGFRVNTHKISIEDFEKINVFSNDKIPYVENGYYFDFDKIGNHPYHHAGMIYIQEPAAMMPIECLDFQEGWSVLDMCAAPGGKSTQIKTKIGKKGVLVSNEIIPSRCKILTGNIERLGLENVVTTCMDTNQLAEIFENTFNVVSVDAPCSGEGMFRKEENAVTQWSTENLLMCAKRQSEILENAHKCVKNGGYIIYATCTFSLEENEMVVDRFIEKHPEYELIKPSEKIIKHTCDGISFDGCHCKNIHYTRRFYPHTSKGEGQFAAVLHNTKETPPEAYIKPKPEKIDEIVLDFLDDVLISYDRDFLSVSKDTISYFCPNFPITKGTVFSKGITVGEIKKNYVLPHHQFFMGLGKNFKRKINLSVDSNDVYKYLNGQEISADCPNGWAVVMVDGCSLGGTKVVNGVAKNHYPKGLRIKNF